MHLGILQETGHAEDQEKAEDNQGHPNNKRRRKIRKGKWRRVLPYDNLGQVVVSKSCLRGMQKRQILNMSYIAA